MSERHRNRVDPWGDVHAVAARGLFTGNRGCVVDGEGRVVRHHVGRRWITCLTEYRERRWPLAAPRRWTPMFFLDDAVALAAGHRPCATCRPSAYRAYRDAITRGLDTNVPLSAAELDERLSRERLRSGRGVARAVDRVTWTASYADLPDGTVTVDPGGRCRLLRGDCQFVFGFAGWHSPSPRPGRGTAVVLTPATSVAALSGGLEPVLHPTAA